MLAHKVDSDMIHMTHRASLASLKKLSSESNYGDMEIWQALLIKHIYGKSGLLLSRAQDPTIRI